MDNDFNFTIPETLRDIKLSQWQKYIEILEKNKDAELTGFLEKKLLGIFCEVELKDIDRIGLSVFDNTIQHLSNVLNSSRCLLSNSQTSSYSPLSKMFFYCFFPYIF